MTDRIDIMQDPSFRMGFKIIFTSISKLKRNNTELKDKNNKLADKLLTAKDIIKIFLDMDLFQIAVSDKDYEVIEQAEKFLKEVEK